MKGLKWRRRERRFDVQYLQKTTQKNAHRTRYRKEGKARFYIYLVLKWSSFPRLQVKRFTISKLTNIVFQLSLIYLSLCSETRFTEG